MGRCGEGLARKRKIPTEVFFVASAEVALNAFKKAGLAIALTDFDKKNLSFCVVGDPASVFVTSIRGIAIRPGGMLEIFLAQTFYIQEFGSVAALKYHPLRGWILGRDLPFAARAQPVPIQIDLH